MYLYIASSVEYERREMERNRDVEPNMRDEK